MERSEVTITSVVPGKSRNAAYKIELSDGSSLVVDEDVLVKHRLVKDKTLAQEAISAIMEDVLLHEAYAYALRSLAVKAQSAQEMRRKLFRKQYSEAVCEQVIRKLLEHQYINDQDYAVRVSGYRVFSQKKGKRLAAMELKQKGVDDRHIQFALEQIDEDSEYKVALDLARKKWNTLKDSDPQKRKTKLAGFLMRRGYASHHISKALRQVQIENDDADEYGLEEFE